MSKTLKELELRWWNDIGKFMCRKGGFYPKDFVEHFTDYLFSQGYSVVKEECKCPHPDTMVAQDLFKCPVHNPFQPAPKKMDNYILKCFEAILKRIENIENHLNQ